MRMPRWRLAIVVCGIIAIAVVAVSLTSPRVLALYYLFWGRDSFKQIFYEGLGLGDNASSLLSTIAAFFTVSRGFFIRRTSSGCRATPTLRKYFSGLLALSSSMPWLPSLTFSMVNLVP